MIPSYPINPSARVHVKVTVHPSEISSYMNTTLICPANEQGFLPREDRAGVHLSGDNAQAVFPPNACVFVAK